MASTLACRGLCGALAENMNTSYVAIENIWTRAQRGEKIDMEGEVLALLLQHRIRPRQDDGELRQINISKASSAAYAFVIGFRYIKRDGSCTEDHYLCRRDGVGIEPHYGRRLETTLQEYRGTHKEEVDFTEWPSSGGFITQTNTITFTKTTK